MSEWRMMRLRCWERLERAFSFYAFSVGKRNVVWSVLVVERMKRYGWEIGRLGKNGVSGVGTVKKVSEVRWEWNSELSAMSEENLKL